MVRKLPNIISASSWKSCTCWRTHADYFSKTFSYRIASYCIQKATLNYTCVSAEFHVQYNTEFTWRCVQALGGNPSTFIGFFFYTFRITIGREVVSGKRRYFKMKRLYYHCFVFLGLILKFLHTFRTLG